MISAVTLLVLSGLQLLHCQGDHASLNQVIRYAEHCTGVQEKGQKHKYKTPVKAPYILATGELYRDLLTVRTAR